MSREERQNRTIALWTKPGVLAALLPSRIAHKVIYGYRVTLARLNLPRAFDERAAVDQVLDQLAGAVLRRGDPAQSLHELERDMQRTSEPAILQLMYEQAALLCENMQDHDRAAHYRQRMNEVADAAARQMGSHGEKH